MHALSCVVTTNLTNIPRITGHQPGWILKMSADSFERTNRYPIYTFLISRMSPLLPPRPPPLKDTSTPNTVYRQPRLFCRIPIVYLLDIDLTLLHCLLFHYESVTPSGYLFFLIVETGLLRHLKA
jgi:hypothetical protein